MLISGPETIRRVREHQSDTLLAFSCGKDAIAAWLAIRPHFDRVVPYYQYLIPGLEFVDESLDYYERFFGVRIHRVPHPTLYEKLNHFTFQPPERCMVLEQADLAPFDHEDIRMDVCDAEGIPTETMCAIGVRAADSPIRRMAIKANGPIGWKNRTYYPVWDWLKVDMVAAFRREGVKLPVDYKLFGRSFDGIGLRYLLPIKEHFPRDYQRILDWFPLAELELYRYKMAGGAI